MLGFDIDRGEVRRRLYTIIEKTSEITGSIAAGTVVLTGMMTQFGELGVNFPEQTVMIGGALVAIAGYVNKYVLILAKSKIVDVIDEGLSLIDSTPE